MRRSRETTGARGALVVVALALALGAGTAAAQTQEASVEEVIAYQAWYQASQAGDVAKATEAGQAFLKQFPDSANASYVKQWLGQLRGGLFNQAIKDANTAELIRLGREQLAEHPDDLAYLLALSVNLRKNVLLGSQKNPEWEAAAGEFAGKAIGLVEGGAVPAGADPTKFNKDATLALLEQVAAVSAQKADKNDAALAHYEKSLALAPTTAALAGYNGFYCGKLRKDKYDAAVAAYQALPEEARTAPEPGPEVTAALDAVNAEADAAVACWAAFLGATQKTNPFGDVRGTIEEAAKALWQSRHPDDAAGLDALIAKYAGQ
jgi:hypothetical protein